MSFIKRIYKEDKETTDDFTTRLEEFRKLKYIVPEGKVIFDPFYFDGSSAKYIAECFKPKKVIHENKDFISGKHKLPQFDIIVTNPPFTRKYDVLKWLLSLDKPFVCLFPMQIISTQKFTDLTKNDSLTIIIRSGRMRFERNGKLLPSSAHYPCVWICKGLKPSRNHGQIPHMLDYVY